MDVFCNTVGSSIMLVPLITVYKNTDQCSLHSRYTLRFAMLGRMVEDVSRQKLWGLADLEVFRVCLKV